MTRRPRPLPAPNRLVASVVLAAFALPAPAAGPVAVAAPPRPAFTGTAAPATTTDPAAVTPPAPVSTIPPAGMPPGVTIAPPYTPPAPAAPAPAGSAAAPGAPAAAPAAPRPVAVTGNAPGTISLAFRDASLQEVFEMLSRRERMNILLGKGVTGVVSVNLYDVTVRQAIHAIAEAAGYTVEMRGNDTLIVDRKEAGLDSASGNTRVRSFKVQYSDPETVGKILGKHLSRYGKITPLPERRVLLVEDLPDFLERIAQVLLEVDAQPRQILIEAKILEISLDESESFGIDWSKAFGPGGQSSIGTAGLAGGSVVTPPQGLYFNVVNRSLQAFLSALSSAGRVHTLSTPRLLALENQEASTKIGDNIGYRVTTTINNVTTESIQFLETGVILRFLSSVDEQGHVVMKIHPEVSSGTITGGIPSKNTTEVTTQLVAEDGQAILIGGLIKNTTSYKKNGVPILGDIPGLGKLFSRMEAVGHTAETVVLITPHVIQAAATAVNAGVSEQVDATEKLILKRSTDLERKLEWTRDGMGLPK